MTELLQKVFEHASRLSQEEQDRFASLWLAELEDNSLTCSEIDAIFAEAEAHGVDWRQAAKDYPDEMEALQSGFERVVSHADQLLGNARQLKHQMSTQTQDV